MARATLSYNLNEEREYFNNALKADDYHSALSSINDHLRRKLKYENLPEAEYKLYEEMRTFFFEIINSYGIEL